MLPYTPDSIFGSDRPAAFAGRSTVTANNQIKRARFDTRARFGNKVPFDNRVRFESLRVPIDCAVELRFEASSPPLQMIAANISMSGMFIRDADSYEPGTVCEVRFALQQNKPLIRGKAEVLWCRHRDEGPDRPKGVGVRFLDLDLEGKYQVSRLVDQYIRLGELPFHLSTVEADDKTSHAGPHKGRLVLLLALVFLAGIAAGSIGSLRLVQPSGAPGVAGLTADNPRAFAAARPALTGSPLPTTSSAESEHAAITAAVEDWAAAWADKDVERYLSHYSHDFVPASGSSFETWKAQRRDRLARPGFITVEISSLEVEAVDGSRATVRFDQSFASPGYRDRVKKALELIRQEQRWRIVREQALPPAADR